MPCLSDPIEATVVGNNNLHSTLVPAQNNQFNSAETKPLDVLVPYNSPLPRPSESLITDNIAKRVDGMNATAQADNSNFFGPINMRKVVPVVIESTINSKLVRIGDQVNAKLKENLYYGSHLLAPANSLLEGQIISLRNSRTLSQATFTGGDRFKADAALEIAFKNIHIDANYNIPIDAKPVHQQTVRINDQGHVYGIGVDRNGKVIQAGRTLTNDQKTTYNTLRVATIAPLPGNLIVSLGGTPIVMATVGAISPDIVFNKPIDSSVKHRRLKGMGYGFVTNLPGAFFVQAVVEKGNEIAMAKGDEMMIDITISNQLIHDTAQLPQVPKGLAATPPEGLAAKPAEGLTVKAEILNNNDSSQSANLPLKNELQSSCTEDYSASLAGERNTAPKLSGSGLDSQNPDSQNPDSQNIER